MTLRSYGRELMKVDMSAQAITIRLKRVSQLRDLCVSLGKAKESKQETNKLSSPARKADSANR